MNKMIKKISVVGLLVSFLIPQLTFAEIEEKDVVQALEREVEVLQKQVNPSLHIPLPDAETREIISSSVQWLLTAQEDSGHFLYEYFPYENEYSDDDNIVRQAGTLFQLGEVARRDPANSYELSDGIEKSLAYFETISREGEFNGQEFKCIPTSRLNSSCKLGATALALTGLLGYVEAHPQKKDEYRELITDYTTFVVAMKKDEGGFRNRFNLKSSAQTLEESPFFNGEAMLALVRSHALYPNSEVKQITDEMFDYISSIDVAFDTSLYLWAMAAIKDMNDVEQKSAYLDYVRRYTDWRMAGLAGRKSSAHNYCAYAEGLASAYGVLQTGLSADALIPYERELDFWLSKSADLQIQEHDRIRYISLSGEFGEIEEIDRALGGFLTGHTELSQRIDFTQHCLSAYLQKYVDIDGNSF